MKHFDMESYIKKRILEIKETGNKVLYKEYVQKTLLEMYEYMTKKYDDLEDRVFNEMKSDSINYSIYMSIIEKELYDETDEFLKPIIPDDLKNTEIIVDDILNVIKNKKEIFLYSIFLQTENQTIRAFENENEVYIGTIKTNKGEYKAKFKIYKNVKYMDKIEELYHIFHNNNIMWQSICIAYLHKIFDVYLYEVEEISEDKEIEKITINFKKYEKYIKYNMVPIWNLSRVTEKTSNYPESNTYRATACIDNINYIHYIFAKKLDANKEYLVINQDIEITNINRIYKDLVIVCQEDKPVKWELYKINEKTKRDKYKYKVLSNKPDETFLYSLQEHSTKIVKTKAEIARIINSFEYNNILSFEKIEIEKEKPQNIYTYNMDSFVIDEIRSKSINKEYMVLYFKKLINNNYLDEDIASFLTTQIQMVFPEYICIGKII